MMPIRPYFVGFAALLAFGLVPAVAQEAERYQLERTQDGYVRLDTTTGVMALCQEARGRLACVAASESEPVISEIEALRQQIAALENRLAALESLAPVAGGLPADEEFERGIGYMERFFRMFLGLVREFQSETTSPSGPTPERT